MKSQSNGDRALRALNGDRIADVAAELRGDSAVDIAGEGGIRSRANRAVDGADEGYANWVGGAAEVGDL